MDTWSQTLGLNAYAWSGRRRIEIGPIVTVDDYVVGLHEVGHVRFPCKRDHVRVVTCEKPRREACCMCEIAAWEYAAKTAQPGWTKPMQNRLAQALATYKKHSIGQPAVARKMDFLMSFGFYAAARLARLKES